MPKTRFLVLFLFAFIDRITKWYILHHPNLYLGDFNMRFFLDSTRSADPLYFSLSTAQWLSLPIILGIIIKKLVKRSFYQLGK
jgi:hypothetical protein